MPVVFSQEIDMETLDATDFEVTTADGEKHVPDDGTFKPANEAFELRTVLLVGEYGEYPDNEPASVKIVGNLLSRSGQNYKGQEVPVIGLAAGPVISYAEYFNLSEDYPFKKRGRGCDCPWQETFLVVRAVWSGGVRNLDGDQLGSAEANDLRVTMVQGKDTVNVKPYMLADLKDNDNNIDLCLKESGRPIKVSAAANIAIDLRDDPNEYTEAPVVSRW